MASSPPNPLARLASPASSRAGAARSATADYFGLDFSIGERSRTYRGVHVNPSKKRRRVRHSLTDDGGHARQRLRELLARVEPFKHVSKFTEEWSKTPVSDDVDHPKRSKPALRRTPSNIRRRQRRARIAMNKQNSDLRATPLPPGVFTPSKAIARNDPPHEDSPGSSVSPASSSEGTAGSHLSYFNYEDPRFI